MKTIQIEASARADFGKKAAAQLRREGLVPCVIYGEGETISFTVDQKAFKPLLYTPNSYIVEFNINGKIEKGVMRELQFHPVNDQLLHADFSRVVSGKPISIDVPVKLVGVSAGVKQGGKLALSKRKLRILGSLENLPDMVEIDVTELQLGKSIFVEDLHYDNFSILTPATTAICAVKMTRAARGASEAK